MHVNQFLFWLFSLLAWHFIYLSNISVLVSQTSPLSIELTLSFVAIELPSVATGHVTENALLLIPCSYTKQLTFSHIRKICALFCTTST